MSITVVELEKYQCDLCGAVSETGVPQQSEIKVFPHRPFRWALVMSPGNLKHICPVCVHIIVQQIDLEARP